VAVRESGRRHGRSLGAWRAPSAVRRLGACCPCGVRLARRFCVCLHTRLRRLSRSTLSLRAAQSSPAAPAARGATL